MNEYEIIATLDKYPYQGIQAVIDKLYLYNPDAVNALIEQLNEMLKTSVKDVQGAGNIVCTKEDGVVTVKDTTFVFEFDSSQNHWVINHNLDKKPTVTIVDSAESVVACEVQYIDSNNLEIRFNAPFKGTAYLN